MTRHLIDPFASVDLTIEYVDLAAGSRKTLTAVALALGDAKHGQSTIFAMPTLELIKEMAEVARRDRGVPVYEITSAHRMGDNAPVEKLIGQHVQRVVHGHVLFVTHEGLNRVVEWPRQAAAFNLVIDEAPEVILSRRPFSLRYSHNVLTIFLTVRPSNITAAEKAHRGEETAAKFTAKDAELLAKMEAWSEPYANATEGEKEQARRHVERLRAKQAAAEEAGDFRDIDADTSAYYQVLAKPDDDPVKAQKKLRLRVREQPADDIFRYLEPVPRWLLQNGYLFTARQPWDRMLNWKKGSYHHRRGLITLTGFRRPDELQSFNRVTLMSALFQNTMAYAVWSTLGVRFVPSSWVRVNQLSAPLGSRRLRIFWLSDDGWSKTARDKSGGISKVLELIAASGVLDPNQPVCVIVNKDDGSEANPKVVTEMFPTAVVMPHNVRGQNRWRHYDQLIHCAALNSYTPDIRWLEGALGIDAKAQRIARTGQEVYQAAMRLSLRDPTAKNDVTLVVMDRDVADWLPQWFVPRDQVEVAEINSSAVIQRKLKPGRPAIGSRAMTAAERQRRKRQRNQGELPAEPPAT